MAIGPRLDLRTSQSLIISPQLQVAIKLLALSNLELQAEIGAELERNPLLEVADEDGADSGEGLFLGDSEQVAEGERAEHASLTEELVAQSGAQEAEPLDVDMVEERFHHDCASDSGGSGEGGEDFDFDSISAEDSTLAHVLERQAASLSGIDQAIALHIISLIDEAGYLTDPLHEIADRLGIPEAEVERVLFIVQGFEPTGVGARNLAECIALQAREADRYDPCMQALIANLELVARGDLAQLRRVCGVDAEDLADMLRELRSYNPKPGLVHGSGRSMPVVPDIFVRRNAKGWTVELNSGTLPRLIVNRQYHTRIALHAAQLRKGAAGQSRAAAAGQSRPTAAADGRAENNYLESCISQANWLMRVLDQRATTILKVATALLEQQQAFFEHGVQHLKPLTLRSIADTIGMHESTVSRVTSNKYLSCSRGVFELKYFFTHAIHTSEGGADASVLAVRSSLKALIDAEDPLRPLSDDKLLELLRKEGFDLARRTVTKYREAMNIPTSYDRRRRALVKAA